MTLALPKWGLTPLGLGGLVPLLLALRGLRPGAAAALGGLFGLAFNLGVCYWVAGVVQYSGHLPGPLAGLVLFLLLGVLAIWPALWAAVLSLAWSRGASGIALGALAWAGLEWVRSWFLTGFPWMDLGYLLTPWTQLIQTADLGGVALSSALVAGTNLALAAAVRGRVKPLALALACWLLAFGYGGWRLAQVDRLAQAAPQVQVQVVQGNVDQSQIGRAHV
jgi:apolipoprotein N-acyltransferase